MRPLPPLASIDDAYISLHCQWLLWHSLDWRSIGNASIGMVSIGGPSEVPTLASIVNGFFGTVSIIKTSIGTALFEVPSSMLILASIANGYFGTVIIEDSLEMPLLAASITYAYFGTGWRSIANTSFGAVMIGGP